MNEFNIKTARHLEDVINTFILDISDESADALKFIDAERADLHDLCCDILDKLAEITGSNEDE